MIALCVNSGAPYFSSLVGHNIQDVLNKHVELIINNFTACIIQHNYYNLQFTVSKPVTSLDC